MAAETTQLIQREILATLASGALYPFGRLPRPRRTNKQKDLRTVVFVHGFGGNPSGFFPLMAYLRAHGVKNFLCFSYRGREGIEPAAIALRDFLRTNVRGGKITFICHSLGGIVARLYLQELGGARRTEQCITLGAPLRGTYNAFWLPSRLGRELRPQSTLLTRIKARRHLAQKVRFFYLTAECDHIVLPRAFATEDGEETICVTNTGHLGLLFSPAVFRTILDLLSPAAAFQPHR